MPREPEIQPGSAFHLPAAQEKNVTSLIKVLGKKEATDALTEMAKVKPSTWTDIKDTVGDLKALAGVGGVGAILSSFTETIKLQIENLLSPIQNEINQAIADQLAPLMTLLSGVINDLSQFLSDNKTGAGIGGIAGEIAAMFLPGGKLLVAIGALIGAAIQQLIEWIIANMMPLNEILEESLATVLEEIQGGGGVQITAGTFGQVMPGIILDLIDTLRERVDEEF